MALLTQKVLSYCPGCSIRATGESGADIRWNPEKSDPSMGYLFEGPTPRCLDLAIVAGAINGPLKRPLFRDAGTDDVNTTASGSQHPH
jgi:hypothetical protein